MLNKVQLVGQLGHAPEIGKTQGGSPMARLSLATHSFWKNAEREAQQQTEWHHITIFREATVTWVKEHLRKGDTLLVEGKLSYAEWENKQGQKQRTAAILISGRDGNIQLIRSKKESLGSAFQKESEEEGKTDEEAGDLALNPNPTITGGDLSHDT